MGEASVQKPSAIRHTLLVLKPVVDSNQSSHERMLSPSDCPPGLPYWNMVL